MNTNKNVKFVATPQLKNGTCTVFLRGEFDLSVAPDFRELIEPFVGDDKVNLVLNLKELTYIDSTGIGILLSILKVRNGMEANFLVQEVPDQIQKLFDMTGIAKFFAAQ
ncbi:anti-sigma B factor antagonist [Paenibacillus anaericanus]|uniref:Anti-sigma factor antagonist n=1 Tax=Paenibacillus anaericanus TaxID=170367 RepID=A0A3S1DNZ6_9BACL|nr:STAS domain-containing protein [Paenibacillus anaericanus]MDQ0091267.1 anti-sigma B factor antagonist [Paenibacillus anaericanus]RUT43909.1 anti-sigma factor antagonist [Paenibacillus anaericanus]